MVPYLLLLPTPTLQMLGVNLNYSIVDGIIADMKTAINLGKITLRQRPVHWYVSWNYISRYSLFKACHFVLLFNFSLLGPAQSVHCQL